MKDAEDLIALAVLKNRTVCSCESLTAGLFCDTIASISGASQMLKGGLVTYFTAMKEVLAHVPAALIEQCGVISQECALAMAVNTRRIMEADYCVSFTGNAGPGTMEDKPAGLVYCAIASAKKAEVYEFYLPEKSRNEVRQEVVGKMIKELQKKIREDF